MGRRRRSAGYSVTVHGVFTRYRSFEGWWEGSKAEAKQHIRALIKERVGLVGFYAIRTFLLFAEIKPVRLDPR